MRFRRPKNIHARYSWGVSWRQRELLRVGHVVLRQRYFPREPPLTRSRTHDKVPKCRCRYSCLALTVQLFLMRSPKTRSALIWNKPPAWLWPTEQGRRLVGPFLRSLQCQKLLETHQRKTPEQGANQCPLWSKSVQTPIQLHCPLCAISDQMHCNMIGTKRKTGRL